MTRWSCRRPRSVCGALLGRRACRGGQARYARGSLVRRSTWASDPDRARALARKLRAGRIRINGSPVNERAPHGGFKLSGIGRYGVEEFLEYKSIG
ncbi:aldehyde dehydrogenase family protein [Streptomyces mirabilis]|uniref:aldehyde dehydrogenase family protein n=1 Tax=Streptomyces mirabilis TaxID=68239 RepID=UPI00332B679B